MLLTKHFLHLNYFSQRQNNIRSILGCCLNYFIKTIDVTLVLQIIYLFKISILKKISPRFSYIVQITAPSTKQVKTIGMLFFNILREFSLLKSNITFKTKQSKKKIYTVIRSPFVYKSSREQFVLTKTISSYSINIPQNIFIMNFFEKTLSFLSNKVFYSKILIKKLILL